MPGFSSFRNVLPKDSSRTSFLRIASWTIRRTEVPARRYRRNRGWARWKSGVSVKNALRTKRPSSSDARRQISPVVVHCRLRPVIQSNECCRNQQEPGYVQAGMDHDERTAIRDEGHDPDHTDVIAALERLARTLSAHRGLVDEMLPALGLRRTASLAISADSIGGMTPHPR